MLGAHAIENVDNGATIVKSMEEIAENFNVNVTELTTQAPTTSTTATIDSSAHFIRNTMLVVSVIFAFIW